MSRALLLLCLGLALAPPANAEKDESVVIDRPLTIETDLRGWLPLERLLADDLTPSLPAPTMDLTEEMLAPLAVDIFRERAVEATP